ncbi:amidohydrolase family protein [Caballeronia sp. LZ065]|uniref:amidohydrolase family protein n=1 Tax=Caballeronia sp. LZ065 TaxID=3038571 RepID=UPI00285CCA94|nr:amidohydrolase family protein [Caballeronia sp. LZ065]MDR5781562.1 amidohydrolase family protein [Caballeronia sp. LZ065]
MTEAPIKQDASAPRSTFGALSAPDLEWLEKAVPEAILFSDLPIVDPHHHLWDRPGYTYLLPEFAADLATGHNVVATVYADCSSMYRASGPEAMKPVGETEFVLGQRAQSASGQYGPTRVAAGMFGHADLRLGRAVREVLDAHVNVAEGFFKGVRLQANWDASSAIRSGRTASPGLLKDAAVREGMGVLAEMNLVFDCYAFFTQLDDVADAAEHFPNLTIVLNHCGGPLGYGPYVANKEENYARWRRGMERIARYPNVVCKLNGVLNRSAAFDYLHAERPIDSSALADLWRQWIEPCIEAFGAERCMFESNYPVEKVGVSYAALWNAFKRLTQHASDDERTALFSGTASRVYGLDLSPDSRV